MCYIITAIKLQQNEEAKKAILRVFQDEQNGNKDGTASLCFNKTDNEPRIERKMKETSKKMENNLNGYDITAYHFRASTSGKINEDNVHFWKKGNWIFAHNGTISGQADEERSDSRNLFNNIIEKGFLKKNGTIDHKKITEYINGFNFWGRFMIIHAKSKKVYFFGDFNFYIINKSYLCITSKATDFKKMFSVYGIDFETEQELEILSREIEGIYMLDTRRGNFKQISEDFDTTYHYKSTTKTEHEPINIATYYPLLFNANGTKKTNEEIKAQVLAEIGNNELDDNGFTPTENEQLDFDQVEQYEKEKADLKAEREQKASGWKKWDNDTTDADHTPRLV